MRRAVKQECQIGLNAQTTRLCHIKLGKRVAEMAWKRGRRRTQRQAREEEEAAAEEAVLLLL